MCIRDRVDNGLFRDNNVDSEEFKWTKRFTFLNNRNPMEEFGWAKHLTRTYTKATDQLDHYIMKNTLLENVWNRYGTL